MIVIYLNLFNIVPTYKSQILIICNNTIGMEFLYIFKNIHNFCSNVYDLPTGTISDEWVWEPADSVYNK